MPLKDDWVNDDDATDQHPQAHNDVAAGVNELTAAMDLKADLASPALTGVPTAPTADPGTTTTQLATTAFVQAAAGGATVQVVTAVTPPPTPAANVVWVDLSGIGSY